MKKNNEGRYPQELSPDQARTGGFIIRCKQCGKTYPAPSEGTSLAGLGCGECDDGILYYSRKRWEDNPLRKPWRAGSETSLVAVILAVVFAYVGGSAWWPWGVLMGFVLGIVTGSVLVRMLESRERTNDDDER